MFFFCLEAGAFLCHEAGAFIVFFGGGLFGLVAVFSESEGSPSGGVRSIIII